VIKTICNVALNALKGDVKLSAAQKQLFKRHRHTIQALSDRSKSLSKKRHLLQQKGGAFFIPALIGGVLSLLGSRLFGGATQQQQ
jgi:hypothetical protein